MNYKKVFGIFTIILLIGLITTSYIMATSGKFNEPSKKPNGLPATAKFNPDTNEYYDSELVEWNVEKKKYELKENNQVVQDEKLIEKKKSIYEAADEMKKSNDEVDIALYNYVKAYGEYVKDHPELALSSKWEVGIDGPLNIITDLGIEKIPQLIKHIDKEDPFCILIQIGLEKICKTRIADIDPSELGVKNWKDGFNSKLSLAKTNVDEISKELNKRLFMNENEVNNKLSEAGIFALPYVYDLVVTNSNSKILKYASAYLPEEVVTKFGLKDKNADEQLIKKAIESSKPYVEIIKELKAD